MPIDPSISLQAKSPSMVNKISDLVNLQQNQLNLQTAQAVQPYEIARQKAVSQGTVLGINQKAMGELQSHFTSVLNGPIPTKLADPDTPPEQIPVLKQQLKSELDKHYGYAQAVLKGTGIDPTMVESQLKPFYDQLENDPRNFQQFGRDRQLAVVQQSGQISSTMPSGVGVDTGQVSKVINTNPYSVGFGKPIPGTTVQKQLPPTTPVINPESGAGGYLGPTGNKAPRNIQSSLGAGEQQAYTSLVNQPLEANNYLVNSSPLIHNNTNSILAALKEGDITTGQMGPLTAKVLSSFGIASDTAEQKASAYDLLGKRLAQNAQQLAQGFGPNTNAGLEQTTKAWGTEHYNPTAIATLTKQVESLATLKDVYAKGVQIAGQKGPKAIQLFDTQFGANSNIADSLFVTSSKRNDMKGMQEAAEELGYKTPQGKNFDPKQFLKSPQYMAMRHRLSNLNKLETNGGL